MELITERCADKIAGTLSCYDRMIVQGTLPIFCYAEGMTKYLHARGIRIFDFKHFAKPLTDAIKANAETLAADAGLSIDYIRKKNFRKEDKIKSVLAQRGEHPGLVWVFSALELLYDLSALVRQDPQAGVPAARRWQMPALLFLLHR
jgi:hypothetical protein